MKVFTWFTLLHQLFMFFLAHPCGHNSDSLWNHPLFGHHERPILVSYFMRFPFCFVSVVTTKPNEWVLALTLACATLRHLWLHQLVLSRSAICLGRCWHETSRVVLSTPLRVLSHCTADREYCQILLNSAGYIIRIRLQNTSGLIYVI